MGTTAPPGDSVETRFEVYKPWYLQPGVSRPTITNLPPTMKLGVTYGVNFAGPASVTGATLQRLTSVTHSTDPNQRSVEIPVVATTTWNRKHITIEPNRGILPPGMYLMTLRDWRNIPSKSLVVRIVENTPAASGGSASAAVPCCCC
jgi:hypothetical protein